MPSSNMLSFSTLLFIASFTASFAFASPIPDSTVPDAMEMSTLINMTPPGSTCMLVGNRTLYPMGMRVGIYLQWFATIFANFFVPSVARSMRSVNTIMQLAVFFGTCFAVTNLPELDALEAFVLLTFCVGSITAIITSPNMDIRVTRLGSIGRLVIFLAIFIFGSWFWFSGVKSLAVTDCTQDFQFIFFWRVNLYHWFMHFSQAFMIVGSIAFFGLTVWECLSLSQIIKDRGSKHTLNAILDGQLMKDSVLGGALQQERYAWVSGALLVIMLVTMAAFVTTIEGALKYSNAILVWELDSVVELIPFVVGLFSMLKVCFGMLISTMSVVQGARSGSSTNSDTKDSRPNTSTTLVV